MRVRAALLICAATLVVSCAQPYLSTSSNPALVHAPLVGVADFSLVEIDGQLVGAPSDRALWRIDSGTHRLAVVHQGDPLILNAKLEAGHHYRIMCETTDVSVKGYVRDLGTNKIASNIAEQPLMGQPARPMSSSPLQIPVVPR